MKLVRYGKHPSQLVELAGTAGPLVVLVHGGYWRHLYDRRYLRPAAAALAESGYRTALIEYRRLGEISVGWRTLFDDVLAAIDTANDAAGAGPADAPFLAGHSAGGQLALWAASQRDCRGVIAWAPVADLHRAAAEHLSNDAVVSLLGGTPAEVPDRYESVSPTRSGAPRCATLIVHGTVDRAVPLSQSVAVRAAGASTERIEVQGADHFDVIDPDHDSWKLSTNWLGRH